MKDVRNENYDIVLCYKPQGIMDPTIPLSKDRFLLAIQSEFQKDMYQQFASSVICIDSTHKTNVYDFKLITLMVVDEYGEGRPV